MGTKVASYLMGIPPGNKNPEKPAIIVNFIEGVWKCGDEGTIVTDYNPVDADVAVVQGFVHPGSKKMPHLDLRKRVFDKQQIEGKRSIIVDSNLFLSYDPDNTKKYLRYSYDGVFPNTGEYCNDLPDPSRWEQIKRDIGIELQVPRYHGKYILICCQRDGGWSMDGQPVMPWLVRTINIIRKFSDRMILVRFHPGDKNRIQHIRALQRYRLPGVAPSNTDGLLKDLKNAYAVINYNSSPAVVAAIEGIPTFVLDPDRSQAAEVSHHSLSELENPREFDRESWIRKMAQMHWTLDELKDGTAWRHLRQWAKK
jgi:hypothetical protein